MLAQLTIGKYYSHYLQIYTALRRSRFTIWMIPFAVSGGHTINAINEYPTSKPTLPTVLLTTDKIFYFELSEEFTIWMIPLLFQEVTQSMPWMMIQQVNLLLAVLLTTVLIFYFTWSSQGKEIRRFVPFDQPHTNTCYVSANVSNFFSKLIVLS